MQLLAFQRRFLAGALAPGIESAHLSLPRGNGKSTLAGLLCARALTPGDSLFRAGSEIVLVAASIEQARIVFRVARDLLGEDGYRFMDASQRVGITHPASNTRLRVQGSNARTAFGLVNVSLVVADEPGAWETRGGELMHEAVETALGKPDSAMRVLYIGTIAPAHRGWWPEMVERGSHGTHFGMSLSGDPKRWDLASEIRRCNPLMWRFELSRRRLLNERDAARKDSRLRAAFISYRLNHPAADESTMLLDVSDWELVCARSAPPRRGRPVVGADLGGGRAWSAAVAIWPTGRCEAVAVAAGIPGIADQERRDRVPSGAYSNLVRSGQLVLADGLRVPPPALLAGEIHRRWGRPAVVVSDNYRFAELKDAAGNWPLEPRKPNWEHGAEDVRALRKLAADGPLAAVEPDLLTASLAAAEVRNSEHGNTRLVKRDAKNNQSRDDVAAALVLAAGAFVRRARSSPGRLKFHVAG